MENDATTILGSVSRQDHKEEAASEPELRDVREGGMLIAGLGAFQVEEIASAKQKQKNK